MTRLEVAKAEAVAAFSAGERGEALSILQRFAREARSAGLRQTAWDMELLMTEIQSTGNATNRAEQIKHEASAKGILRIAALGPRLVPVR
jgi:hypothetical protein